MEHYISLTVSVKGCKPKLPKLWFQTARAALPAGLCCTIAVGDEQVHMKSTKKDGKVALTIPLVRNLTEKEVQKVIAAFDGLYNGDFSVSSTRIELGVADEIAVEVDYDPLISLCTAWAKDQHDSGMKDKVESGWRYGPSVSMANKTHPLLRPWADLPDAYKVIDTSRPEELLKLFNEHGYVLVAKEELDKLMNGCAAE